MVGYFQILLVSGDVVECAGAGIKRDNVVETLASTTEAVLRVVGPVAHCRSDCVVDSRSNRLVASVLKAQWPRAVGGADSARRGVSVNRTFREVNAQVVVETGWGHGSIYHRDDHEKQCTRTLVACSMPTAIRDTIGSRSTVLLEESFDGCGVRDRLLG